MLLVLKLLLLMASSSHFTVLHLKSPRWCCAIMLKMLSHHHGNQLHWQGEILWLVPICFQRAENTTAFVNLFMQTLGALLFDCYHFIWTNGRLLSFLSFVNFFYDFLSKPVLIPLTLLKLLLIIAFIVWMPKEIYDQQSLKQLYFASFVLYLVLILTSFRLCIVVAITITYCIFLI